MKKLFYVFTFIVALCFLSIGFVFGGEHGEDRGFNSEIDWYNDLEEAKEAAQAQGKPIFLLIHKSWCGACKRLKPEFQGSLVIESTSKHFIMVNLEDDEEPTDERYRPDGAYVPRIFFLDENGDVLNDTHNKNGNPKYQHFFPQYNQVTETMTHALEVYRQQKSD
eukprot:CAMPEP_0201550964 /NCGR_PEP_ID=MMETSP0173_2-20130828/7231_1 /ASSEMBLY_ACC=CAM_ASM_000268 /TAXON_ID=218659 /ORGANISM="Vexillifera sp., Strain DIVA3 564/2" /LENGTH=164 /DNA_ID=CAMNT_0047961097 /DNA_START=60 /DNA_END=554 /DNA_ORIENTATION=+